MNTLTQLSDADLNRQFARAFWNSPIDERNNTYWHVDQNCEWKPLPDFVNDWSAVRKILAASEIVIQPDYSFSPNRTDSERCRRVMVAMLSKEEPAAPTGSHASAGAEKGDGAAMKYLRECRRFMPKHGTWAENNLDSIDALLSSAPATPAVAEPATEGAAVPLYDCPTGLFYFGGTLCFKSEYGDNNGRIDAYVVSSGEAFWGGTSNPLEQRKLMVVPVDLEQQSTAREASLRDQTYTLKDGCIVTGQRAADLYDAEQERTRAAYSEVRDLTAKLKEAEAKLAEQNKDIEGILEECAKEITLSNDFPWAEEVHCAFRSLREKANSSLDYARTQIKNASDAKADKEQAVARERMEISEIWRRIVGDDMMALVGPLRRDGYPDTSDALKAIHQRLTQPANRSDSAKEVQS